MPTNTGDNLYNLADHKLIMFFMQLTPGTIFVVLFFITAILLALTPVVDYVKKRFFGIDEASEIKDMVID